MGGPSSEYEISLATGRKILASLDPTRYIVQPVIVTRERRWLIPPAEAFLPASVGQETNDDGHDEPAGMTALVPRDETQALDEMRSGGVDAVFIAMHGEFGEDGTVQGLLESIGVPYTGSGVLASALGMDKARANAIFRDAGLTVPEFVVLDRNVWRREGESVKSRAEVAFGLPLVVKPSNRGSSVGVTIANTSAEVETGIAEAFRHADTILLQRYIRGTELTCGVLDTATGTIPLQPTEIVPQERQFFDYHSKYTPGATNEITPPHLPSDTIRRIQEVGLRAHRAIGARGMSRTDMILGSDGRLYVLEINTVPGMTEMSLLPQAAAAVGIPFPKLLDTIIETALRRDGANASME